MLRARVGPSVKVAASKPYAHQQPVLLHRRVPEIMTSTRKSVERVPKQCRTSVSQGPIRENPRVS
eukprot:5851934-Pyramimonas_sp.AAC.1